MWIRYFQMLEVCSANAGEDEYIQIYPFLDMTKHYIMSIGRSEWPISSDLKLLNMNTRHEKQQVYKVSKNIHTAPQDKSILKPGS